MSDTVELAVRMARISDAEGIARVYVESWQETYAGILPTSALAKMSVSDQARQWRAMITASSLQSPVFVAASAEGTVYGFASAGPARDLSFGFDAEVYTLYVAPGFTGQGLGRELLSSVFRLFSKASYRKMIIWALAANPSRYFYEAMGGRLIAERQHPVWGASYSEVAYGWDALTLKPPARKLSAFPTRDG
jgi:L-amino acid N-acyltransferase YncA